SGADPNRIRLSFDRHVRLRIDKDGSLIIHSPSGEFRQQKPVVYQEISKQRQSVEAEYVLIGDHDIGFRVGEYDHNQTLIIDPILVFSTYLGGAGDDSGSSIARDAAGNIYLAGNTTSANFPTLGGAFSTNKGLTDIFVTKLDPTGASIIYSTYVGGSGLDRADGIADDVSGNAYVVGRVGDTSTDFPTTAGALATTYRGGDFDGIVFKLNSNGNALAYSTFIGGEDNYSTEGIAVDASGHAYITGGTRSIWFPTTITAYQGNRSGDTDAFLAKLNSTGSALLYSTYLGGSGTDRGSGVAIDASGNAYLAG